MLGNHMAANALVFVLDDLVAEVALVNETLYQLKDATSAGVEALSRLSMFQPSLMTGTPTGI